MQTNALLLAVVALVVGLAAGFFLFSAPQTGLVLPDGAKNITACLPGVGVSWSAPNETNKVYLSDDTGAVVGVEFTASESLLNTTSPATLDVSFPVSFMRTTVSSKDSNGQPYAVIQLYAIAPEDAALLCAPAKASTSTKSAGA